MDEEHADNTLVPLLYDNNSMIESLFAELDSPPQASSLFSGDDETDFGGVSRKRQRLDSAVINMEDMWENCESGNVALFLGATNITNILNFTVKKQDKNAPVFSMSDNGFVLFRQNQLALCCELDHPLTNYSAEARGEPLFVYCSNSAVSYPVQKLVFTVLATKHDRNAPPVAVPKSSTDLAPLYQASSSRVKKDSKQPDPVPVQKGKAVFQKLHFMTATLNNMRSHADSPSAAQQYYRIVVSLCVQVAQPTGEVLIPVQSKMSPCLIVRGQNPGRYVKKGSAAAQAPSNTSSSGDDSPTLEVCVPVKIEEGANGWQQISYGSKHPPVLYHTGRVGINTQTPSEALTVHGNILVTGEVIKPSDRRLKTDFQAVRSADQLKNIEKVRIYDYEIPNFGDDSEGSRRERGVIAQELMEVLPEAVKELGNVRLRDDTVIPNLLVVNDRVLLLENIGATQELDKELKDKEHILAKLTKQIDQLKREKAEIVKNTDSKVGDVVDLLTSEDHSLYSSDCCHCSVFGLGPAWTLYVLGFFIFPMWAGGAMYLFSRFRVHNRLAASANLIMFSLTVTLLSVAYWNPLAVSKAQLIAFTLSLWLGIGLAFLVVMVTHERRRRLHYMMNLHRLRAKAKEEKERHFGDGQRVQSTEPEWIC